MTNLAGILAAHTLCRAMGVLYRFEIQLPLAGTLSILLYLGWGFLVRSLRRPPCLHTTAEHMAAGLAALLWNPVVLVPLHFMTQGYLSSAANVFALALFQLPVNAAAVFAAAGIRPAPVTSGAGSGTSGKG
jgi:hypothetical protein